MRELGYSYRRGGLTNTLVHQEGDYGIYKLSDDGGALHGYNILKRKHSKMLNSDMYEFHKSAYKLFRARLIVKESIERDRINSKGEKQGF